MQGIEDAHSAEDAESIWHRLSLSERTPNSAADTPIWAAAALVQLCNDQCRDWKCTMGEERKRFGMYPQEIAGLASTLVGGIGIVLSVLGLWWIGVPILLGGVALFLYAQHLRRLPYQTPSEPQDPTNSKL
jgi:hypothetical protein